MWTRANNLAVFQFFYSEKMVLFFLHLPPSRGICAIRGTVRVVFPFLLPDISPPPRSSGMFFSPSTRCFRFDAVPVVPWTPFSLPLSLSRRLRRAPRRREKKRTRGTLGGRLPPPHVARSRRAHIVYCDAGGMRCT